MTSITLLGTGTSTGVPLIGCTCQTCISNDPRDTRLRTSALIKHNGATILIDCGPDLRQQALKNHIRQIDAVLLTHHHFDHIGGFDDLRAFNFVQQQAIHVYGTATTIEQLKDVFGYAFHTSPSHSSRPVVRTNEIGDDPFTLTDVITPPIIPIDIEHGEITITGYRIGNIAYCTDCSSITADSLERLQNLDILVLSALRHTPHPMHMTIGQAIAQAITINARMTIFTHMSHDILHQRDSAQLPPNVYFGTDGLTAGVDNDGTIFVT